ncbi:hypothetical protein RND81_10G134300 [Saponaria officinalis]|uniref:Exostosin GT47 domain-containing protein n=1 Tax=Saponaria officinalis TaxID=3572 RepID=A0AAW1I2W1_SAPOF
MTATIATITGSISYLLFLVLLTTTSATTYDPYFSKTTLFSDYSKMLSNLKIFIYPPPPLNTTTTTINFSDEMIPNPLSLFHTSLLNSPYLTRHPTHATLFFLPFPPLSTRSLARHIQHIRTAYPFWNRSLGADHFYLTRHGVGPASTRNVVELVKNAVQISTFPSPAREFIPHKDLTLPPYFPPLTSPHAPLTPVPPTRYLGYATSAKTFPTLENDDDFLIESATSDDDVYLENIKQSKFCLFNYADVAGMNKLGAALAHGCVPVVISDRPIQDFPLMDIIRWSEIAMFVGPNMGIDEIKRVLKGACEEGGGYERMRGLGVEAAHHMMWNVELEKGEPLDAFEMVIYQLWLRRHSIRYATWDGGATQST